jgi:hypothetical protein
MPSSNVLPSILGGSLPRRFVGTSLCPLPQFHPHVQPVLESTSPLLHSRPVLSKLFSPHTTVTIQNVRVPRGTANINACSHDTVLPRCFAGWQASNLSTGEKTMLLKPQTLQLPFFPSNLTSLDDRRQSVFILKHLGVQLFNVFLYISTNIKQL